MAQSLNQMPNYQARLPRTGHDIGRDFYFTSSVGMILPVYRARLNQGETISFGASMNTILRPLRRPTQCKIRQKIDVFFVPLQMLYTPFGQHFYQTNDYLTSGIDPSAFQSEENLPLFRFSDLFKDNDFMSLDDESISYYNRASIDNDSLRFDDEYNYPHDLHFDSFSKSAYRLLMHLGYNPHVVFSFLNQGTYPQGLTKSDVFGEFSLYQPNVFADFLYAYNAIYENYYRNDDRELRDIYTYQQDWQNSGGNSFSDVIASHKKILCTRYHQRIMDYFTSIKVSPIASVLNMSGNAGFDGGSNRNIELLTKVDNYLFNSDIFANDPTVSSIDNSGILSSNKNFTNIRNDGSDAISPANIRGVFAVEKLLRIYGRARKDYDSQTLAHLGFKVPRDIKHEITFLGSIDGGIGVKTITSTAGTEQTELGELAGNGFGNLQGKIGKFTAPCHGVFMAVYYAIPEVSYSMADVHDKLNDFTNRLDLYQPEFDHLGMQPVYTYEAFNKRAFEGRNALSYMIGWQYRYEQYKRQYDVHSVAFHRPNDIMNDNPFEGQSYGKFVPENAWSPWILGARPFESVNIQINGSDVNDVDVPYSAFLVSPTYLNGVFVQDYDPYMHLPDTLAEFKPDTQGNYPVNYCRTPWLIFQTDPFMHALRIDASLVSTMSTYGEPELL